MRNNTQNPPIVQGTPSPSSELSDPSALYDYFSLNTITIISVLTILADQFADESDVKNDHETMMNAIFHIRGHITGLAEKVKDFQAKNGQIWPDLAAVVSHIEEVENRAMGVSGVLFYAYENVYGTSEKMCLDNKTVYAAMESIIRDLNKMESIVEEFEKTYRSSMPPPSNHLQKSQQVNSHG